MMASTEEDVMRMRLLVDGDGTGDDRRLNMLLKALVYILINKNFFYNFKNSDEVHNQK